MSGPGEMASSRGVRERTAGPSSFLPVAKRFHPDVHREPATVYLPATSSSPAAACVGTPTAGSSSTLSIGSSSTPTIGSSPAAVTGGFVGRPLESLSIVTPTVVARGIPATGRSFTADRSSAAAGVARGRSSAVERPPAITPTVVVRGRSGGTRRRVRHSAPIAYDSQTSIDFSEYQRELVHGYDAVDEIQFQYIGIEQDIRKPPPGMLYSPHSDLAEDGERMYVPKRPVITVMGTMANGMSACVHIHGFLPYIYIECRPDDARCTNPDTMIAWLDNAMQEESMRQYPDREYHRGKYVMKTEIVRKKSMYYFRREDSTFMKITFARPRDCSLARGVLGPEFAVYEANVEFVLRFMVDKGVKGASWLGVPVDSCISRRGIPRTSERHRYVDYVEDPVSTCQIELDVWHEDLKVYPPNQDVDDGRWMEIAPLRVLSFDIECLGKDGRFPTPDKVSDTDTGDPVIQIANMVYISGKEVDTCQTNVFVIGTCDDIPGSNVYSFTGEHAERDLLEAWFKFIRACDPDVITGYNISGFDLQYVYKRAELLGVRSATSSGRLINRRCRIKVKTFSSKAYGTRTDTTVIIPGRVCYDMLTDIRRSQKLRSYTLNNVSAKFIGDQKEDVHYSEMGKLQRGSSSDRQRLAVYCIKDAVLPVRLMVKLMTLVNAIEMARVTGVPFAYLLERGQQIKVVAQILDWTLRKGFVMPTMNRAQKHEMFPTFDTSPDLNRSWDEEEDAESTTSEKGYKGATVIDAIKGFYEDPITTLDFASLYPSIMIAHNICYTTILRGSQLEEFGLSPYQVTIPPKPTASTLPGARFVHDDDEPGEDGGLLAGIVHAESRDPSAILDAEYGTLPEDEIDDEEAVLVASDAVFVKKEVFKGLLPSILEDLLAARREAKKAMKKARDDPFKKAVLNGRQLALKVSCNSVYGFTGATIGRLPCLPISSSVTAFGRDMIFYTKREIEGRDWDGLGKARVVYGDTDSVMIQFHIPVDRGMDTPDPAQGGDIGCIARAIKLGKEAAEIVNMGFIPPIRLEFEKVFWPYLLMSKKRYVGMHYENPKSPDKMNAKGIEIVRRDNCKLVVKAIKRVLDFLLIKRDVPSALVYVRDTLVKIRENEIDLYDLVISKSYAKADYKSKMPHVELAKRMYERDPATAPRVGDRVPYIVIAGPKKAKVFDLTEDPIYVMKHRIRPNPDYYMYKQLKKPLGRIFDPIIGKGKLDLIFKEVASMVTTRREPLRSKLFGVITKRPPCMKCKGLIRRRSYSREGTLQCVIRGWCAV
jgi:DNA polymerase delta subunit 1